LLEMCMTWQLACAFVRIGLSAFGHGARVQGRASKPYRPTCVLGCGSRRVRGYPALTFDPITGTPLACSLQVLWCCGWRPAIRYGMRHAGDDLWLAAYAAFQGGGVQRC
jgi:hypothetical protein